MSVEQTDVVDIVAKDRETGGAIVIMVDPLDWEGSTYEHLMLVQEKINAYLRFIESGEINQWIPGATENPVRIEVQCVYPLVPDAEHFYTHAKRRVQEAGFGFVVMVEGDNE
jgi:hypothetical protein